MRFWHEWRPKTANGTELEAPVSRRGFLTSVTLLAGLGGLVPLAARYGRSRLPSLDVGRRLLGTWVRISIPDADPVVAGRAAEAAFAAVAGVDRVMSIHRADSELSAVNAAAGRHAVPVDESLLRVTESALARAQATDGVYDPTILPLMRLYGFYNSGQNGFPTDREIAATLDRTGWRQVRIDRAAGTIGLAREGMALDLGSIGKGWALDRAVDALRAGGIGAALVDIGGNVYGLGAPPDEPDGWSVGVLHPGTGRVERLFRLRDRAVATSGNQEQAHLLSGIRVGHLLDARKGRPADGPLSASVEAATGTESDVLSTAAYLQGPDRFRAGTGALSVHFIG